MFLDGSQLTQVASASAVVAGTFAVNDAANTLTIGSNPSGHELRSSDLGQAMYLSGPGSIIQGIGFRRYATPYEARGTVRLSGIGGAVRNVFIQDVATVGLSVSDPNKQIDKVTVKRAGLLGIGGNMIDNSTLTNSVVSNDNSENFNVEPASGGIKITSARKMLISNVEANNNIGTGIWMDVSSYNMTIVNSTANANTKHGIELEISDTALVANNVATNGGEDGILVFDTGNVKLFNNEVGGSSLFGIKLAQDARRQAALGSYPEARDPRYKNVVDPTVPFITQNIQVVNNVFGNGPMFQLYAQDGATHRAVDDWNVIVNGNLFNKRILKDAPDSRMVAWGTDDNVTLERYETPDALAAAKNSSWTNSQLSDSRDIAATAALKYNYGANAVPLPADIADATGLPAGAKVVGVH
jgi:parallel beta-helix repeat protein